MAQQNQDSFIYQLVVQLDDNNALNEMSQSIGRLTEITNQASGKFNQLAGNIVDSIGNDAPKAAQRLQQELLDLADAGADRPFNEIQDDVERVLRLVQRLDASDPDINFQNIVNNATKLKNQLLLVEDAQAGVNQALKATGRQPVEGIKAARQNIRRTSQTSQNLLRIIQDAPFGILGVANNIQALAEDLGRASTQGRGMMQQLTQGFKNLITGPFAIPAAITAVTVLAQSHEKLFRKARQFGNFIGLYSDLRIEIDRATEAVDKATKKFSDWGSVTESLVDLQGEEQVQVMEVLEGRLAQIETEMTDLAEEGRLLEAAVKSGTSTMGGMARVATEATVSMKQFTDQGEELRNQQKLISEAMRGLNAESIREAQLRNQLKEIGIEQEEQLDAVTEAIMDQKEAQEEANEETELATFLTEQQRRIQEERLQLRGDNLLARTKEIEQQAQEEIATTRQKFKEKIKIAKEANDERVDELKSTRAELIRLIRETADQEVRGEIVSSILDTEGEFEVRERLLGGTDVEDFPSVVELIMGRSEEEIREEAEGEFEIVEITTENAIKSLERQREQLRERQPDGLFGGFITTETIDREARLQNVQKTLRREQQLRQKRLNERLEMLRTNKEIEALIHGPNSQQVQKIKANIRSVEQQKADIEQEFQRKRLQNQKEFQRQKAKGIVTAGTELTSRTANVASDVFNIWMQKRQQDLENQGKTQEEQRKILKREGKRRFQFMKAMKIANTVATGISSAHQAWERGMEIPFAGGPALAAAFTATSLAQTALRVRQLSNLSIGDKLPGGGGGGGGGLPSGNFTQLSAGRAANRAATVGTQTRNQRENQQSNKMNQAADKMSKAADRLQNMQVTMDERASLESQDQANVARSKFRK